MPNLFLRPQSGTQAAPLMYTPCTYGRSWHKCSIHPAHWLGFSLHSIKDISLFTAGIRAGPIGMQLKQLRAKRQDHILYLHSAAPLYLQYLQEMRENRGPRLAGRPVSGMTIPWVQCTLHWTQGQEDIVWMISLGLPDLYSHCGF